MTWFIYTMEYYSAVKKNEIMSFVATWMDLEIIILSEVNQKEECDSTYMWNLKYGTNDPIYKTEVDHGLESRLAFAGRRWGEGRGGLMGSLGLVDADCYI